MYVVFSVNVRDGEHEYSDILWMGSEEDTEETLKKELVEYLETLYDDADIEIEDVESKDPLSRRYSIWDIAWQLSWFVIYKDKADAVEDVMSHTKA